MMNVKHDFVLKPLNITLLVKYIFWEMTSNEILDVYKESFWP